MTAVLPWQTGHDRPARPVAAGRVILDIVPNTSLARTYDLKKVAAPGLFDIMARANRRGLPSIALGLA